MAILLNPKKFSSSLSSTSPSLILKYYNFRDFARILSHRLETQTRKEALYARFFGTTALMQQFLKTGSGGKATKIAKALEQYKIALKAIVNLVFSSLNQGHIIGATKYLLINVPKVG